MRRRAAEGVALVGAAGTFWYLRIRSPDDAETPSGATPALSPRTGAPLQLTNVQIAFRHGARLPNQDVLHPGETAFTGPAAWTTADTAWDPAEGVPFRLNDYKMKELAGGAANKRITNSSRYLAGGGNNVSSHEQSALVCDCRGSPGSLLVATGPALDTRLASDDRPCNYTITSICCIL